MIAKGIIATLTMVVICMCVMGCSFSNNAQDSATKESIVIGHIETRDKFITIRSASSGPLYTIKTKAGEVLLADISTQELSVNFPELKKVIEEGIAEWAGMDLNERMP